MISNLVGHQYSWDSFGLSSGVYHVKITAFDEIGLSTSVESGAVNVENGNGQSPPPDNGSDEPNIIPFPFVAFVLMLGIIVTINKKNKK